MSETWTAEQIGALIRQCFVSERGELVVADFAQIEPRTTLWLAGDEGNLEVFRRQDAKVGPDAYLVAASRLYGEPVTDKADKRRQAGKVAVIACLAAGTPVITERGAVAIEAVLPSDRVWDGVEWVNHGGLVARGLRACLELDGVRMTPDHLVLTEAGWRRADTSRLNPARSSAPGPSSGSTAGPGAGLSPFTPGAPVATEPRSILRTSSAVSPLDAPPAARHERRRPIGAAEAMTRSWAIPSFAVRGSTGSPQSSHGATTPSPFTGPTTEAAGSGSSPHGERTGSGSSGLSAASRGGTTGPWSLTGSTTTAATNLATSAWLPGRVSAATPAPTGAEEPEASASGAGASSFGSGGFSASAGSPALVELPTFDLVNAGPRSRFVLANGLVVHNCGYQAGPDTVEKWAAKQGIDLAGAGTSGVAIVESWRGSTPLVAGREVGREFLDDKGRIRQVRKGGFWRQIENQAWLAIEGDDGRPFYYDRGDLFYELPSGRCLRYRQARIEPVLKPGGKVKDAITFFNAEKNRRTSTYGGKLTENVVQAIDRDLLAAAIVRVENEVAPVVMHTHDELVADSADPEGDMAKILKIMTTPPVWAAGLPIAAEGGHHRRYAK